MKKKMTKKAGGKATHADAQIVMHLFELRRDPEMRKARDFMAGAFWPNSMEDLNKVANAFGTDENRYYRMVTSYWEMAASLVLRGAVDPGLFNDWSNEMYFILAKFHPMLSEIRTKGGMPNFMMNSERVAKLSPEGKAKLEAFGQRITVLRQRVAGAK